MSTVAGTDHFLYGDGINTPYALHHPLFSIYLKEKYFKNGRRIKDTQSAIANWGKHTIEELQLNKIAPIEVPKYLINCYSQHLTEYNAPLKDSKILLTNQWRLAHLSTPDRHLSYVTELEKVSDIALKAFSSRSIGLDEYFSTILTCSIYLSSINSMGKNVPVDLRHFAIVQDLMTVGQALRQIKTLSEDNQANAMIALFDHLSTEQYWDIFSSIKKISRRASKKQVLSSFKKLLEEKGHHILALKVTELLTKLKLDKEYYEPSTIKASDLVRDRKENYQNTEQARNVLHTIKNIINTLNSMIFSKETNEKIRTFIGEFNQSNNNYHRTMLTKQFILSMNELPPKELVDLMSLNAQLVILTIKDNFQSYHSDNQSNQALFLCQFISIALTKSVSDLIVEFTKFINELAYRNRNIDVFFVDTIIELYGFIKKHSNENTPLPKALESNLVRVIERLQSGNNRVHSMLGYIKLVETYDVKKDAIIKALLASELIEDDLNIVNFKSSIAKYSKDQLFIDNTIAEALSVAKNIIYIETYLTCLEAIARVTMASTYKETIENILTLIKTLPPTEVQLRCIARIYNMLSQEQKKSAYRLALSAIENEILNWQTHTWITIRMFSEYLTQEDKFNLYLSIPKNKLDLRDRIHLLESCPKELTNAEISSYLAELRTIKDEKKKCYLMSELAKISGKDDLFDETLTITANISDPIKRIDALSSISRGIINNHYEIFREALKILEKIEDPSEKKKATIKILTLKDCTDDFIIESMENSLKSTDFDYRKEALSIISNIPNRRKNRSEKVLYNLANVDFNSITKSEEIQIKENIFPHCSYEEKNAVFPHLLAAHSRKSRTETLSFISKNLTYLHEIGGENLLTSLNTAVSNAKDWWP